MSAAVVALSLGRQGVVFIVTTAVWCGIEQKEKWRKKLSSKLPKISIVKTFKVVFFLCATLILFLIARDANSAKWKVVVLDSGESVGVYQDEYIKLINSGVIINQEDLICMVNSDIKTKTLLKFNDETVMFDLSCDGKDLVFTPSNAYDYLIASDVMRGAYTLDIHSASGELLISVPMIGYNAASKESMLNNYWSEQ